MQSFKDIQQSSLSFNLMIKHLHQPNTARAMSRFKTDKQSWIIKLLTAINEEIYEQNINIEKKLVFTSES